MAPKVSIIVLTFNSEKYIERLVSSILAFNKGSDFEIIVVDNNSTDNTLSVISNFKFSISNFRLIRNRENVGFSRGINSGAKEAKGEYLLFINPDTEWKSGSVDDLVSVFETDSKVGVVGGKILTKDGKPEKSVGKFLKTAEVLFTSLGLDETLGVRFSPNKRKDVDFVSGGFMAVRKDLFEKLGGLDENLFMYVEDMEFCFRAKKEGMKVMFEPLVQIMHESHGSSNRGIAIENIYKGLLYFHKKHGTSFSYNCVKFLFLAKAFVLVSLGKIINNKYLTDTYSKVTKI